jgi:hypothetical protein
MSKETIKVLCRLRPENAREKESGYKNCVNYGKDTIKVIVRI